MGIWIRKNDATTVKQEQFFQKTDTGSVELGQLWEKSDTGAIQVFKKGGLLSGNVNLVQTNEYTITATPIDSTQPWWFFFHVDNSLREDNGFVQFHGATGTIKTLGLNVALPTALPAEEMTLWAWKNSKAAIYSTASQVSAYLRASRVAYKNANTAYLKIKTTLFSSTKYTDFAYNAGDSVLSNDNAYVDLGGYGIFAAANGNYTATITGYNVSNQTWKLSLLE